MEESKYMVLDHHGNPIMRKGDEVNSYLWTSLIDACVFANEEKKNYDRVMVVELRILVDEGSGM